MPPTNRATEFKAETYVRLTTLTKTRLNTIRTAIDRLCDTPDTLTSVDIQTLNAYVTEIERKKTDFETNLQRVLLISGDDALPVETLSVDQDYVNDTYVYISSRIRALLPSEDSNSGSDNNSTSDLQSSKNVQIRLPKLDLPKFTGDLTAWTAFINLFDATIHQNSTISNVMKFQYLLSVVQGEPLNLIKSLSLTSDNYLIAYQLLRDHYHNDRRLQSLHLNRLLDLPSINASNTRGVRQFINEFSENSQALAALDCPVGTTNPVLAALLLRKLDVELRKRLEGFRSNGEGNSQTFPEVQEIIKFLNTECTRNENATLIQGTRGHDITMSNNHNKHWMNIKSGMNKKGVTAVATNTPSPTVNNTDVTLCFICNSNNHRVYNCSTFKSKTPQERYRLVKQHHHCVSCLGYHDLKNCRSQGTCVTCQKRHHSLLHFVNDKRDTDQFSEGKVFVNSKTPTKPNLSSTLESSVTLTSQNQVSVSNYTVLLGTVLVRLQTSDGNSQVFRALLDSGSMCDLISERAVNLLNARRQKSAIQLTGIDQTVTRNKGQICASIFNMSGQLISSDHQLVILDKLTVDIPRQKLSTELVHKVQSFSLADPNFHTPGRIDMVIGSSLFPQILTCERYSLGQQMPYVLGTQFGHVVMGNAPCISTPSKHDNCVSSTSTICFHAISDFDLHNSLQKFWVQEEPPTASKKTHDEDLCDKHFSDNHTRNPDGRYILRLPLKESYPSLGSSYYAAETRLVAMERKFERNDSFSELYHAFMDEYLQLGHMSKCVETNLSQPHYFLPHHGVLKENSSTTKLRTVFDASCKTSSGICLNDILLTGRKLQTNICDVILQFRRHNIVFCCDIKQMYRQILIHPDDRKLQLILWRDQPNHSVSTFELNTVTYGVNSSPYMAIRTLHQLAEDEGQSFPEAAYVLKNHTYVDDIITGANTEQEALQLQTQLISLLQRGGFELRKWISNSPQLLHNVPETYLETPKFLQESSTPQFSVLGLHWSPISDGFSYNLHFPIHISVTKRIVLSTVAKLYDPCGFLSPFVFLTKCFMQLIWTKGCTWDEPLPPDLTLKWRQITEDTHCLTDVSIPRSLNFPVSGTVELHGFCDASESGFAAVLYFRNESLLTHDVTVNFVMAKSKVAPLKRVTLPRLELCAAHLLAKLVDYCREIFADKVVAEHIYLWCDSTIVLTWLKTPSYQLKTYVANRVAQTQELTPPHCWRYIPSQENPADCASRGILASQLVNHPLWWVGPSWLSQPHEDWPSRQFTSVDLENSEEIKKTPLSVLISTTTNEWDLLTKFSSWNRLVRVMGYVLRFIRNIRNSDKQQGVLTITELKTSTTKIIQLVQASSFAEDISNFQRSATCSSKLRRLSPFLDEAGLLRVGGRLKKASLPYDSIHPVLLPKKHHVVDLIVDDCHKSHLHAGPQLTQAMINQHYWIISARQVIRSRIFRCIVCFKTKPRNIPPLMGDLPASRITPARPFSSIGTDFCGPFTVKVFNLRAMRHVTVYICVFVCLVTKAVHLEVVTDLTTDAFIASLTRFVSRRGLCSHIYSDCGTNFVGADSALRKILHATIFSTAAQKEIQHFSIHKGIEFHFNPPAAPHQGGLWESAIKSAKHHLRRVMGEFVLTLMGFVTLTTQIEAMLNSRPLTPLSNDPADCSALTPGHFLIGAPLTTVPEPDLVDVPINRLKHWQFLQSLHQCIWKRWQLEYLHTLQQRSKWTKQGINVKIGDLVLIHTSSPPLSWPLARVTAVHPGSDGVVRVVDLKTQNGHLTRPVVKVFPLPLN